jgi:hypothetical protein
MIPRVSQGNPMPHSWYQRPQETHERNRGSLKKWLSPGLEQYKCKGSLEHLVDGNMKAAGASWDPLKSKLTRKMTIGRTGS